MPFRLLVTFTLLLAATPAAAHPGHGRGGGSHSVIHYLSEPPHVVLWLLGVAAMAVAVYLLRRARRERE